ncbi:MAG: hypothetical protein KAJ15_09585 [Spirochaetes bacterium]|nr:hypothetical protein [Spirochaetota bacterium]
MLKARNVTDVFYSVHKDAVNSMYMIFSRLAYQLPGICEQFHKSLELFPRGFFELFPGI